MKLSDFLTGNKNKITEPENFKEPVMKESGERLRSEIKAFTPGKILQGEVVEKKGTEVTLKLLDDLLVTARLDQEVSIDVGKILNFEVKNNGKSLSLSPLFANTASSDNVMKAIQMAKIPLNHTTIEMTENMMKQQMSIDSKSLQSMFRDVSLHPSVPVTQIISLHQMQMPVNDSNLSQLQSYQTMTHLLIDGMNQLLDDIPEAIVNVYMENGHESALQFTEQLLNGLLPQQESIVQEFMHELGSIISNSDVNKTININDKTNSSNTTNISDATNIDDAANTGASINISKANDESVSALLNNPTKSNSVVYNDNELNELEYGSKSELKETDFDEYGNAKSNTITESELSKAERPKNTWSKRLELHKLFLKIADEIKKSWTLEPEQTASKAQIKELYDRIRTQLKFIQECNNTNGAEKSVLQKSTNNLSSNIDFMNQMNQIYTYIQIPLKMSQQNANGELYVFTDKRSLIQKKDSVSALLHLDMEHLGMLNVYLSLQNEKLNTKFIVEDDSILDFLNSHMNLLTKRLEDKGYMVKYEMTVKDDSGMELSPITLLKKDGVSEEAIAQYAFDVRA